jgi:hypothetical protein
LGLLRAAAATRFARNARKRASKKGTTIATLAQESSQSTIEFREPPPSAANQREKILALLRQAGNRGVSGDVFRYEFRIRQAPTRIYELIKNGYVIESRQNPKTRVAIYRLVAEPREKLEWQHYPRRQRKRSRSGDATNDYVERTRVLEAAALPLFARAEDSR